jgi:hypothetical protein
MVSTSDEVFRKTVASWLAEREVLVLIRYSRAGGSKDFVLIDDPAAIEVVLGRLPPEANVLVFREPHLSLRGVVNASFIEMARRERSKWVEYLALQIGADSEKRPWSCWSAGESDEDLRDTLQDWLGKLVAVGPYPNWLGSEEGILSAIVPGSDGSLRMGVY